MQVLLPSAHEKELIAGDVVSKQYVVNKYRNFDIGCMIRGKVALF